MSEDEFRKEVANDWGTPMDIDRLPSNR
jgi:hypothetical protein